MSHTVYLAKNNIGKVTTIDSWSSADNSVTKVAYEIQDRSSVLMFMVSVLTTGRSESDQKHKLAEKGDSEDLKGLILIMFELILHGLKELLMEAVLDLSSPRYNFFQYF